MVAGARCVPGRVPLCGAAIRHAIVRERTIVSNAYRARVVSRLTRRRVLLGAAAVGVGGAAVSVANLSEAFDRAPSSSADDTIIVHVRDLASGRLDVFAGESRIEIRDKDLASRLAKAARKR
jgi:hypothetical protein